MKTLNKVALIVFCCFFALISSAEASSQSTDDMKFSAERIINFAKHVEKTAAEKGARVIIVSRVGRPSAELPKGINYTHVAFGVYSMITTNDGRQVPGYAMYNLYQRAEDPSVSDLVQDYPADFFLGVHELRAGVIIPKPEVQRRLLKVIYSETYAQLHNPAYSVMANPYSLKYQNCTEHTMDVLTAAIYQTNDKRVIKENMKAYYEAQSISVNPFKLMLGSMIKADVRLSDHGTGKTKTATFTTIAKFMQDYELADEVLTLTEIQ